MSAGMVCPFHILVCAALAVSSASAQVPSSIQAGSRVRLRARALGQGRVVATVLASESDTLVLKPDGEAAGLIVPWDSVADLEIGRWKTHELEGAVAGLLAGLLAAAAAGPCDYDDCTLGEDLLEAEYKIMPDFGTRAFVLGGLGLFLGAILGSDVKTEAWRPVVLPKGGGSVSLGLSFSF